MQNTESTILLNNLRQSYQVIRESTCHHCISHGLSMDIKTFARVNEHNISDSHVTITFSVKNGKDSMTIVSGEMWELLKEKYFKPEMVIY